MLKIATAPNPVLSNIAKRVQKVDANVLKLINGMKGALLSAKDPVGVGLAAPQVEKPLQIFIVKPTPKSKIQVFINPKVISKGADDKIMRGVARLEGVPSSDRRELATEDVGRDEGATGPRAKKVKEETKLEGCLSLPDIWGEVKRDPTIKLRYQLITNNHQLITRTHTFSGFLSTIIQHEMDHLQGILFPKRVLEQKGILYKSSKNEKGEDIFEEIEI